MASPAADLREWIALLEREGELVRVTAEVDPDLEITEITDRVVKSGGPALLFENVKGSRLPLLINQFGTERRMCLAFGVERLDDVAAKLEEVLELTPPQGLVDKVRKLGTLKSIADSAPKTVSKGAVPGGRARRATTSTSTPSRSCAAGRSTPRRSSRCRRSSRRTARRACGTSACTACRRSTGARRSCTGRSTRTAAPTCSRRPTAASRSPSRSGSTPSRRTRRARRSRSTSAS